MPAPMPLMERFVNKVLLMPNGCWQWTGYINTGYYGGYGYMTIRKNGGRKNCPAHRIAYELFVGAIPPGLTIDHLCRNRACVNPTHLEPVTQRENVLRGDSPAAQQARRTHCKHGHPLSGDNLYLYPNSNQRACRTCQRNTRLKRRSKRG